jgi:hypothetical protein
MPESKPFPDHGLPYDPTQAPPDYFDPVIEALKKDVDRTLLRENLKLTVEERFRKFKKFAAFAAELQEAGRKARLAGRL